MINLGRTDFEDRLKSFLKTSGYQWPDLMSNVWVKGRFLLSMSYESRESMSCGFGVSEVAIDQNFPRFDSGWHQQVLMPYADWLREMGLPSAAFAEACGDYVPGGLRPPNYELLEETLMSTLGQVESFASNNAFKGRRARRARP